MLAAYFSLKCQKALEENAALYQKLWADPASAIRFDTSGALVDAAGSGMQGLAAFSQDYLEKNADAILFAAIDSAGWGGKVQDAYNLAQNTMAMALIFNNNLVFRMLKEIAWECMKSIHSKDQILLNLADTVKELHLALASLVGTKDLWDQYYDRLREALRYVDSAETDLSLVKNTFSSQDYWLAIRFRGSVTKLEYARDIISPQNNNPAISKIVEGVHKVNRALLPDEPDRTRSGDAAKLSGKDRRELLSQGLQGISKSLQLLGAGLSDQFPFPTTEEQWQATLAIGRLTNQLLIDMQGYFEHTTRTNLLIESFCLGLDALQRGVPGFLKNFILNLLTSTLNRITTLKNGMSLTLNGEEGRVDGPKRYIDPLTKRIKTHKPNSLDISIQGFRWVMEINLILEGYKAIPTEALSALSLDQDVIEFYEDICLELAEMDEIRSYQAVLKLDKGKERLAELELQVLAFALEANNAVISASVREGILDVSRAILSRLELSLVADSKIYELMELFYYFPLPAEDMIEKLYEGMTAVLGDNGFNRALAMMATGQFDSLFEDTFGRAWTYAGYALTVVSLLKQCLGLEDQEAQDQLDELENELNADADLFNVNFSINFDLAILKNLQECARIDVLFDFLSPKELLCAIAQDIQNGNVSNLTSLYNKMVDSFSF